MLIYFNITVIAEWFTFFAALLLLDKKTDAWLLFIPLMFAVLCTETIGWYMHVKLKVLDNALPFNILMILSNAFFIWFFSNAILLHPIHKLLKWLATAFVILATINLLFFQGPWKYNSFSESAADILLVIICCYFLFTIVKSNEHFNLVSFDYFWLATGLLFYCLGSALLYQFSYLLRDYYEQTKIDIGTYVNYTLNLILYTCLIIAFICRRKATRLLQ
jgi:hypothetical protein